LNSIALSPFNRDTLNKLGFVQRPEPSRSPIVQLMQQGPPNTLAVYEHGHLDIGFKRLGREIGRTKVRE
jgi:hypothetical protein